jgi:hypothetical protein
MGLAVPFQGTAQVTAAQLEDFLTSSRTTKLSDSAIADRLSVVTVDEQLSRKKLERIYSESSFGSKTIDQIQILAAASVFKAPPVAELPIKDAPDAAFQRRMLSSAADFAEHALRALPDFLATRTTMSYSNRLEFPLNKRIPAKAKMHFVGERRREITYSGGRETDDSNRQVSAPRRVDFGLTTWGEFGPILKVILSDSFKGSVSWSRWQLSDTGHELAVFSYKVPKSVSHYQIDFCCYQLVDGAYQIPFCVNPGYHGELYIDPTRGTVERLTLEAELGENDPMTAAGIAVDYDVVEIGGNTYTCPVRGVAISKIHDSEMEKILPGVLEYAVNVVQSSNYHKFGSSARIISSDSSLNSR